MTVMAFEGAVLARRDGRCPFCRESIERQVDMIGYVDGRGWLHETCAFKAIEIRRVHELDREFSR